MQTLALHFIPPSTADICDILEFCLIWVFVLRKIKPLILTTGMALFTVHTPSTTHFSWYFPGARFSLNLSFSHFKAIKAAYLSCQFPPSSIRSSVFHSDQSPATCTCLRRKNVALIDAPHCTMYIQVRVGWQKIVVALHLHTRALPSLPLQTISAPTPQPCGYLKGCCVKVTLASLFHP